MRVVFLGTPDFAVLPLKAIIESNLCQVVGVVTNKDKPVGRKQVLTPPPVKVLANNYNIPVFQYDKIKSEGVQDLVNLKPDLLITCAFGQILSQEILDIPKFGVFNIHASLLPKYRGASPINYAILNGEKRTGITIMRTDIGIDTGDIIMQESIDIFQNETCGQLFERLSVLGSECIIKTLQDLISNKISFKKQDDSLATLTKIIKKEDALIDFSKSAIEVVNQIRAFNPSPVAYTFLDSNLFKIYEAEVVEISSINSQFGMVIDNNKQLIVACKIGSIRLIKVQKSGGKPILTKDFLAGNKVEIGRVFSK